MNITDTYPEWLRNNCSGLTFGPKPIVIEQTERYALVKISGHWAKLHAYGQSYVAVSYLIASKARRENVTSWYRRVGHGRQTSAQYEILLSKLSEAERTDSLPARDTEVGLMITNHR